jgi:hypothetical protein
MTNSIDVIDFTDECEIFVNAFDKFLVDMMIERLLNDESE